MNSYLLLSISYKGESSPDLDKLREKIKENGLNHREEQLELPGRNEPDNSLLLTSGLKHALQRARELEEILYISSFQPFENTGTREFLLLLKESGVQFIFDDFTGLSQDNLDILLKFLERKENSRSQTIKERLSVRKEAGKLGNPSLVKSGIQHLGLQQKLKNSFLDENNRLARVFIFKLKSEGRSDSKIANELNEKGYLTRNNKKFTSVTVKRLYESQLELNKLFKINPGQFEKFNKIDNSRNKTKLSIKNRPFSNFKNSINIDFGNRLSIAISLEIENNRGEIVWENRFDSGETGIGIDFLREPSLLPGLHFLYFREAAGAGEILECLPAYFHKELSTIPIIPPATFFPVPVSKDPFVLEKDAELAVQSSVAGSPIRSRSGEL